MKVLCKQHNLAVERQAERERCASAFALREKHSLDRDEDYNDMIVSRNLVGARIIDEMRRFDETTAELRLKSEALYAALDEKRDFATRRASIGKRGASNLSSSRGVASVVRRARAPWRTPGSGCRSLRSSGRS